MNIQSLEFVLVLVSLIIGMVSAVYFYQSTDIFLYSLKMPLKLISSGMILISFGILLAVFISYFQNQGQEILLLNIPISALFFLMYIAGSVLIFLGARQFVSKSS
jgi:hypothetical protein